MEKAKRELQHTRERCRALLVAYPEGPINETLRDYISDLEQQLRDIEQK